MKNIYRFLKQNQNIIHITISNNLNNILKNILNFNINIINTPFRLLNYNYYSDISYNTEKKNIYIYTSINAQRAKDVYGANLYKEIIKYYSNYNFIIAHGQYSNEQIVNIYKSCFIGLRLTSYDGNANTVQELGLLGLTCIHNGDFCNSLNYNNIDDIIKHINKEILISDTNEIIEKRLNIRNNMLKYLESSNYSWLFYD